MKLCYNQISGKCFLKVMYAAAFEYTESNRRQQMSHLRDISSAGVFLFCTQLRMSNGFFGRNAYEI